VKRLLWLLLMALVVVVACNQAPPPPASEAVERIGTTASAFTAATTVRTGTNSCCTVCTGNGNCQFGVGSSNFTDPDPAATAPTSVAAVYNSVACTAPGTVVLGLNAQPIGTYAYPVANCACGAACAAVPVFVYHNRGGIPGYVAGGTNTAGVLSDTASNFVTLTIDLTFSDQLTFAPNFGPVGGGTTITISGPSLPTGTPAAVTFGGVAAASFTRVNATTLTAVSPPGAAGPVDVVVRFPGTPAAAVMTFQGDFTYGAATPTSSALASNANPSVFGQGVTFTATTTPAATGTVFFQDGATTIGSAQLNGAGQASFTTTALGVATHPVSAVYAGGGGFVGSTSQTVNQVVNLAATTTTVISSANPSILGGNVTFTATATTIAPGSGTPVGSVSFFDGATLLGTGALSGAGIATFATAALVVGTHPITASYGGGPNTAGSTSPVLSQVVNPTGTTVSLASSLNPSTLGAAVTFTATATTIGAGGTPTGTVTFSDAGNALGTGTLDGAGVATFTTAALLGGTHAITARYGGDVNHAPATAGISQVVNAGPSTTTLVSQANPSVAGQSVQLTATVSGTGATPTGLVTFLDGGNFLGTSALNGAGQATFATANLLVGTHSLTASYGSDANFSPSTSSVLSQVVGKASTTVALASSSNPSTIGATVTLSATVTVIAPGAGSATGLVTFSDGATVLGTGTLGVSGVATFTTSGLALGTHGITAAYAGDARFDAATSASLAQVVAPDATTATLASSSNPSTFGTSVTFTATVVAAGASPVPTGTVSFNEGATVLGTGTLSGAGVATFATAALAGGTHTITAVYAGDANHTGGSSAGLVQVVTAAASTTALVPAPNPSVFGQAVTLTATVSSAASGTATGTVTFTDGASTLGTATLAAGVATLTTATLAVGSHPIAAAYGGDPSFAASTTTAVSQVVGKASTAVLVSSSSNPSLLGATVTFTATVTATAPGAGTASGTVTFKDGAVTIGTGTVNGAGVAAYTSGSLAAGAHSITAEYGGDGSFLASTSAALAQNVNTAAATITLTASPNPASFGGIVTLTATVTGNAGVPTGTITFLEGPTTLGTGALTGGVAAFAASGLTAGTHSLLARYSGDTVYAVGTGSLSLVVQAADTTTSLASSANPSAVGQSVTLTAAVTSTVAGITGDVEFLDGTASLGTGTLTNGTAQLATSSLAAGGHALIAVYKGDTNHATSTSPAITQTVTGGDAGSSGGSSGSVADAGTGAGGGGADSGGCGCTTPGGTAPLGDAGVLAAFGLVLALARRRRR
jgi:MYXO-CTERM domain-containing protein